MMLTKLEGMDFHAVTSSDENRTRNAEATGKGPVVGWGKGQLERFLSGTPIFGKTSFGDFLRSR
jgi:hypothetical protein